MPRNRKREIGKSQTIAIETDESDNDLPCLSSLPKVQCTNDLRDVDRNDSGSGTFIFDNSEDVISVNGSVLADDDDIHNALSISNDESDSSGNNENNAITEHTSTYYPSSISSPSDLDSGSERSECSELSLHDPLTLDDLETFAEEEEDKINDTIDPENDDYMNLLNLITNEWVLTEIDHNVSKVCSDKFWSIALKWMHRLSLSREKQKIKRKTPHKFVKNCMMKNVPKSISK